MASTRTALGANTLRMGKYALVVAGLLVTSHAVAQSRVDRVPGEGARGLGAHREAAPQRVGARPLPARVI